MALLVLSKFNKKESLASVVINILQGFFTKLAYLILVNFSRCSILFDWEIDYLSLSVRGYNFGNIIKQVM